MTKPLLAFLLLCCLSVRAERPVVSPASPTATPAIVIENLTAGHTFAATAEVAVPLRLQAPRTADARGVLHVRIQSGQDTSVLDWETPLDSATVGLLHEVCPGVLAPDRYEVRVRLTTATDQIEQASSFVVAEGTGTGPGA